MKRRIVALLLVIILTISVSAACKKIREPIQTDDPIVSGDDVKESPVSPGDVKPPKGPETNDEPKDKGPGEEEPGEEEPGDEEPEAPEIPPLIPEYEIRQTLYHEVRAGDGVLLARAECNQPVFLGDGENVIRMNKTFEEDLDGFGFDDFEYLIDMYDNREGYVYDDARSGRIAGYSETWEESFRMNEFISFSAKCEWDGLGPHGGFEMTGRTFNARTGEELGIRDILKIPRNRIADTLYNEYVAYHYALNDGLDELALGYESGAYNTRHIESVKAQCGENAAFWLEDDGVHIFFEQYTFYYAVGASELVIPYSRTDLVREPFADEGAVSVVERAPVWKIEYLNLLLGAEYYRVVNDYDHHDFYSTYPLYPSGALLADLNFDGTPELLLCGDGASASASMRIFAITKRGAEKVLQDWGEIGNVKLYRKQNDGSYAYGFVGGNGQYDYYFGAAYLVTAQIIIDRDFREKALLAEFSVKDEYDYNPVTHVETYLGSTYTFNGQIVDANRYDALFTDMYSGYNVLNRSQVVLNWDYDSAITYNKIRSFLEAFSA